MDIYQINRKIMPASTTCHIDNGMLEIEFSWPSQGKTLTGKYDLEDIIQKYAEDHGCIALCYSPKYPDELIWHETTRFSYTERMPSTRSYTSIMEIGLSVKDTPSVRGRHNAASPAAVLKQRIDATPVLYLLTPAQNCAIDDAVIVFLAVDADTQTPQSSQTSHQFFVEGVVQNPPVLASLKMFLESWLPITINGADQVAVGDEATYSVGAPAGTTVYLDASAGVINRSRAINAQTFTLDTKGLLAGETINIKAGYKFWPSVASKKVTLT